ncbi:MAG: hypothetical protein JWL83_507 [Actinomycetia bacterium]|nr:hypothetical protein [Actinomycetes bacterium]
MGVTRLWFEAELRQRWRQQVALALLVGFVGVVVLTCVAAARRTDSTYRRYVTAQAVPQFEAFSNTDHAKVPALVSSIAAIPGVRATGTYDTFFAAPFRNGVLPGQDFIALAPTDDNYSRTLDRPILVAGRLPNPNAPDEVFVNERAAKALRLHVGSRIPLRSAGADEAKALQGGNFDAITFDGPKPTVRVVGIGRARFDLYAVSYARQYFITSRAFYERHASKMFRYGDLVDIRLEPHANVAKVAAAVAARLPNSDVGVDLNPLGNAAKGLRDAARVQSIALLLVAFAALAAGLVAISQAIGRSVNAAALDHSTLAALGIDRAGRARLTAVSFLPAATSAAVLAVGGAWVASRWFPTGVTREAEVSRGAQFDTRVLLVGIGLIAGGVIARAAFGTWRQKLAGAQPKKALRSVFLDRVTSTLAPSTATGIRWAVGRRDGTHAQSRAGLAGAIIGVAGLLAVVMYTTGLDHVVSTPAAYGWSFDATASGGNDANAVAKIRNTVLHEKSIGDVGIVTVIGGAVGVNGTFLQSWAFDDVRGHIGPSVVEGRAPQQPDEALLGTKSAAALDVGVGDVVHATVGHDRRANLRVVGLGLFPTIESDQFTSGIVTTRATLRRLTARNFTTVGGYENVVFRWRPHQDVKAAAARLRDANIIPTLAAPAADVANLRVVRDYPRWLAIFLAVLGLLATTHALVVSTRRRRREMAVLRAIGFRRRQVSRAVSTQGATIGTIAVVIGVPLGLAIGRWAWVTNANRIGIGTSTQGPAYAVLVAAVGTVALTWLIATAAGWHASRASLSKALRTE